MSDGFDKVEAMGPNEIGHREGCRFRPIARYHEVLYDFDLLCLHPASVELGQWTADEYYHRYGLTHEASAEHDGRIYGVWKSCCDVERCPLWDAERRGIYTIDPDDGGDIVMEANEKPTL